MDFEFVSNDLLRLYTDPAFTTGKPKEVEKAFRRRMAAIAAAADERDIHAIRGNHFKQLQGDRSHQHSIRLNDQFRLIVEIKKGNPKNTIVVVGIEDYH